MQNPMISLIAAPSIVSMAPELELYYLVGQGGRPRSLYYVH
jgi:hypothetical protein